MIRNLIAISISTLSLQFAFGRTFQDVTRNMTPEEKAAYSDKIKTNRMKKTGGYIRDYRSMKGSVVFLNAQKIVPVSEFSDIPIHFSELFRRTVKLVEAEHSFGFSKLQENVSKAGGTCVIAITTDADLPSLLIAPESKWAIINVQKLSDPDSKTVAKRTRREIVRAFGFLCGADTSTVGSVLNAVNKPSDIDDLVGESLGQDAIMIIEKHLDAVGVTAYSDSTYRSACMEGWAPQPTNDFQKAIWESVRATPKNPMKIEFDPKKGR